jgi:hypothetical protein
MILSEVVGSFFHRPHIFVARPFWYRPNLIALYEQMRRQALPNGMAADVSGRPYRTTCRTTDAS